jgi:cytosine/adenosine deaminase-related metal-dependent hydrolase
MAFRKFKPDYLFTGSQLLENSMVLVCQEDGRVEAIVETQEAGEGVEWLNGLISPGFINCHCHLELSHLRGVIPQESGLINFVESVMEKRVSSMEEIWQAIDSAETEMLQKGIVAVGDICNTLHSLQQKKQKRLAYYNFVEISGWSPDLVEGRLNQSLEQLNQFRQQGEGSNRCALAPHAPYSVSSRLWQLIEPSLREKTTTMHSQESLFENELFEKGSGDLLQLYRRLQVRNPGFVPSGKSSLQTCLPYLLQSKQVLLVHNCFISAEDLDFCENLGTSMSGEPGRPGIFFCLCPRANWYIQRKLPPLDLLRRSILPLVLGTDSLASNESLDILEEIRLLIRHFPKLRLEEALGWATKNGARALGLEAEFGSLEAGKRPGILLIEQLEDKELGARSSVRRIL